MRGAGAAPASSLNVTCLQAHPFAGLRARSAQQTTCLWLRKAGDPLGPSRAQDTRSTCSGQSVRGVTSSGGGVVPAATRRVVDASRCQLRPRPHRGSRGRPSVPQFQEDRGIDADAVVSGAEESGHLSRVGLSSGGAPSKASQKASITRRRKVDSRFRSLEQWGRSALDGGRGHVPHLSGGPHLISPHLPRIQRDRPTCADLCAISSRITPCLLA